MTTTTTTTTTAAAVEPRLYQSFRLAMTALYSLPLPSCSVSCSSPQHQQHHNTTTVNHNPKEANDFLVELQSRNVRRKILSLQQKQRDQTNKASAAAVRTIRSSGSNSSGGGGGGMEEDAMIHMGSSWLAFLAVLCRMHPDGTFVASPVERLFAAQSVLHRSRRNKLTDGIDLEIERDDIHRDMALHMYRGDHQEVSSVIHAYQQHVVSQQLLWNPFVAAVLASYHLPPQAPTTPSHSDSASQSSFYEERVKGEVMLLTLASVSYITACQPETTPQRGPILEALGSAITTIALRIRYSDLSESQHQGDENHLISMIRHAHQIVFDHAHSFHPADARALGTALATTLATIPDTILGNAGGAARGRLSVDPRLLEAAVVELRRTGMIDLWNALKQIISSSNNNKNNVSLIATLEQWTRYLCLPRQLVEELSGMITASLGSDQHKEQAVALRFVFSVLEGGGWTMDKVLSFGIGLSEYQIINQAGKRKQSSRSKRRQKEMISNKTTDDTAEHAHLEVMERGEVACRVSMIAWPTLRCLLRDALNQAEHHHRQVDGEGPIGCVATAAQSCLPFLLLNNNTTPTTITAAELFRNLTDALIHMCTSSNQDVRCLALPPLYALNKAVASKSQQQPEHDPDPFVLDVMLQCLTKLASSCAYPRDYFVDLRSESNFELEIYRNEIRDLLRAFTGGDEEDVINSDASGGIPIPCLHLLCRVTQSLRDELVQQNHNQQTLAETIVHTLSALAKPLGKLAKEWQKNNNETSKQCLCNALEALSISLERITNLFQEPPQLQLVLPLSRTLNMGVASFAPLLSLMSMSESTQSMVSHVLSLAVRLSLVSLRYIPELATSEQLHYEIKGTMRGPGGEDHVGALSLMRLTTESDQLTSLMVQATAPQMNEFCAMHEYLKSVESWGKSKNPKTTPKSRRILIGVMCRLEASSSGQAGASDMLSNLVHSIVSSVLSVDLARLDEQSFFTLCEAAFDMASFSSLLPPTFFDHGDKKACLETLVSGAVQGYRMTSIQGGGDNIEGAILQWNRLRGALFTLFLESGRPDLNETTSIALQNLILAECGAVTQILSINNNGGHSPIFNDEVVSPDVIPAGVFLMSIGKQYGKPGSAIPLPHCTHAVYHVSASIIEILLHPAPFSLDEESASDPRCSIAEAWFSSLVALAKSPSALVGDPRVDELLTNNVIAAVALIFTPNLDAGKEDRDASGMTPDGPHTLAMMEYLSVFFALGTRNLGLAAEELARRFPVAGGVQNCIGSNATTGVTLLISALFRAVQGALPPWVVENISSVLCNFYIALDKNPNILGAAIQGSMELRAPTTIRGVESGKLFSGYAFDGISNTAKENFLQEVLKLARTDSPASWKRLKHCVKGACGGKKKDSDFRQKPAMTRWEFERI